MAHILHISVAREQREESSAVASLQHAAQHGSCPSASVAAPLNAVAAGLQPGLSLISGSQAGALAFLPAAQALAATPGTRHKAAVKALRVSRRHHGGGSSGSSRVERSAIGSPSAAGSVSPWIFVLLALLVGASMVAIGRRRLRPRAASATGGSGLGPAGALSAASVASGEAAGAGSAQGTPGSGPAASWDPPTGLIPMAAASAEALAPASAEAPTEPAPDSPAPLVPDGPGTPEPAGAAAFVPEGFAPSAPEAPAPGPASPEPIAGTPAAGRPPVPARSAGRPRVRAGRNWLRRHRQAAAMMGAVAGAALALMVSTASRSVRLISRRQRPRRHR
ncbi:MAG TPA: hypothetical protein VE983_12925 [Solirubrobacteraceae bacterium]|nr:hypothetical protein [Solirubrobacteraceae bacterium]